MASEKEDFGPGLGSVVLIGLLTLALGMALGGVSLVTQQVTVFTRVPDEDSLVPGKVIYVKGSRSGRTSWRGKEQALKSGQLSTLIFTEAELNQWSDSQLRLKNGEDGEESGGFMSTFDLDLSPVNFRIVDGKIQMATEVNMPGLAPGSTFLYQVVGRFVPHEGGVDFVVDSASLGQAPIGALPVAGDFFLAHIGKKFSQIPEVAWLQDALGDLDSAEITDGQLILQRRTEG